MIQMIHPADVAERYLKTMGEYNSKTLVQFKQFVGRPLWVAMKANMTEQELAGVEAAFRSGRMKFFFPVVGWAFPWNKSNEGWHYWNAMYDRIRAWELNHIGMSYYRYLEGKK